MSFILSFQVSERGGVSEGEELVVDLLEFLLGEHARGTVLQETWSVVRFAIFGGVYPMYLCTIVVTLSRRNVWIVKAH